MRIVFMGTPEFARVCLEALVGRGLAPAAVITQPDRPGGRGKKLQSPPVKDYALQVGLPVLQPERIKGPEGMAALAALEADIFVVAAYGQILSQKILDMPKFGAINVHASLLPKYRGASPIQRAIAEGETVTGITIMQMDKGMDTGDMLLKREVAIEAHDTGGTLHDKLCEVAPAVLLEALDLIKSGKAVPVPQDDGLSSYAPLITKQMAQINWHKSPTDIVNLIRAYNPFPGAFARLGDDNQIKVWKAESVNTETGPGMPGQIMLACPKDGIVVAAAGGAVRIVELTPPGGKKMAAADFVRGHKIEAGEVLA